MHGIVSIGICDDSEYKNPMLDDLKYNEGIWSQKREGNMYVQCVSTVCNRMLSVKMRSRQLQVATSTQKHQKVN